MRKARPVRNPLVESEIASDGAVLLRVPTAELPRSFVGIFAKAAKLPQTRSFELEPIGAYVWHLCDGKTTFEGISQKLRDEHKMNRRDADAALSAFLEMLSQRRLVALMIPDKP